MTTRPRITVISLNDDQLKIPNETKDPGNLEELAQNFEEAKSRCDLKSAYCICKRMADLGDPESTLRLGQMLFFGMGIKMDFEKGFNQILKAAEAGVPGACVELAQILYFFDPPVLRRDNAYHFLREAAKSDNQEAKAAMAWLLTDEQLEDADWDLGMAYLEEAIKHDVPEAHDLLGRLCANPDLKTFDARKAMRHFERAVELGYKYSCFSMALMYGTGAKGVEKDDAKALSCYVASLDDFHMFGAPHEMCEFVVEKVMQSHPSTKPWENPELKPAIDEMTRCAKMEIGKAMFELAKLELFKDEKGSRKKARSLIRKASKSDDMAAFYWAMLLIRDNAKRTRDKGKMLVDKLRHRSDTLFHLRLFSSYEYYKNEKDEDILELEELNPEASYELGILDVLLLKDELLDEGIRHLEVAAKAGHEQAGRVLKTRFWEKSPDVSGN